jgi:tetratricopeptide (TPR) repeat protein
VNCDTGDELASEQIEAGTKEHVLHALGEAATRLRKRLGESLNSIKKFDVPIEQVTTSSLEALRAYSIGMKNKSANREAEAIRSFSRAVEIDPNFAAAYARLSILYNNAWEVNSSRESVERAFNLRDRVSERERLFFVTGYDWILTGDLQKAAQTLELWAQSYPADSLPRTTLADYYMKRGEWERALVEAKKALNLDPGAGVNYLNLGSVYLALGRFDAANDVVSQAMSRKIDGSLMSIIRYWTAFLTKQPAGHLSSNAPDQDIDDLLLYIQSDTEAQRGRLDSARTLSRRSINIALREDRKESAAAWQISAALRESEFGNSMLAQSGAAAAMKLAMNWKIRAAAALLFARTGDATRAGELVEQLDREFRMNTMLQSYWLPTVRAAIELSRRNPAEAIEILGNAAPYELGISSPSEVGMMYPVYLRGDAYLMAGKGQQAATEFQKIIHHPGVVRNYPLSSLAYLGLARACMLNGDTSSSRAAYQDFLTIWKDADPDTPIFREAKAEYSKLQ